MCPPTSPTKPFPQAIVCAYAGSGSRGATRPPSRRFRMARLEKAFRIGREFDPRERSLTSTACGASRASRETDTIAVTFPTKLTGFYIHDVPIKIPLVLGFVENMSFALFASVG